jgi:hypothetical protein
MTWMKRARGRLTYANVVSTLALFLAIAGGTAVAADHLAKNSVGTAQIKKGAVTAAKIKNGAVTGAKIKLATLGTVPSAATATSASSAATAGSAKSAGHAATADSATSAGHAETADAATSAGHSDTATSAGHADAATTAAHADTAQTADSATTAGHADSATSAAHADSADTAASAADADALGGSPPQSFMRSDRFAFGTADTEPGTPQTVLSIGGVEVTTAGSNPTEFRARIVNHNADQWEFTTTAETGIATLGEGQSTILGPPTAGPGGAVSAGSMVINGRDRVEPEKAIVIQCGSDIAPDLLECFAQLSPSA